MKRLLVALCATLISLPAFAANDKVKNATERLREKGFNLSELTVANVVHDELGEAHVVFDQTIGGVRVHSSQVVTHEKQNGRFDEESVDLKLRQIHVDTRARLSVSDAVAAARAAFGEDAPAFASLVILPRANGNSYELAYEVEVNNTLELEAFGFSPAPSPRRELIYIDANNGSVIERIDYLQTVTNGSGKGYYSGSVTNLFISALTSGYYYMNDTTTANGSVSYNSRTTDLNNTTSGTGTIYRSTSTVFGSDGSLSNRTSIGIDAHWFAQKTLDYFKARHGRSGIDNKGNTTIGSGYMLSRTHYGTRYNNAFWNGSSMTYGDGDGTTYNPFDAVDVVGHEMTHGITERTSNLIYSRDSGALNESFSDIFGVAVEFFVGARTGFGGKVYGAEWKLGEDIFRSGTGMIRSVENPPSKADPDFYKESGFWEFTSADNYGVHTNSGVQNKVFYLMSVGGKNVHKDASGNVVTTHNATVTVASIGTDAAARIAYRALTVKLLGNTDATYPEAKSAWIAAANDLYGAGSVQATATANAWAAVGL